MRVGDVGVADATVRGEREFVFKQLDIKQDKLLRSRILLLVVLKGRIKYCVLTQFHVSRVKVYLYTIRNLPTREQENYSENYTVLIGGIGTNNSYKQVVYK